MKAYELMLMLNPSLDEEVRAATLAKVDETITAAGGVVDNVEEWGKRRLAFEIDGVTDGEYFVVDFHTAPAEIAELDRVLHITDAVMRFMVVRRDDRE